MGTIISFPAERCRPTQEVAHGHNCLFIPFPKQNQEPAAPRKQAASRAKKAFVGGKSKTKRTSLIAKVKIAQKQLGLSDDVYREILHMNFGVDSCTKLEERELVRLVSYFRTKGWDERPARKTKEDKHGKPLTMKDQKNPARPTLERIEAILAELGKARGRYMPWSYAAAILEKQTGLPRLEQATVRELQNVMVALENTLAVSRAKKNKA
jgi:Protein of unknown function (DUF1018).